MGSGFQIIKFLVYLLKTFNNSVSNPLKKNNNQQKICKMFTVSKLKHFKCVPVINGLGLTLYSKDVYNAQSK